MTRHHLRKALQQLHQLLDPVRPNARTDGQLLASFVARRDEDAFAALVARHGPMVLGVCRRILRHTQDAEDCWQAAFLVLARKAGSVVNHQCVGSWLYRVAYRIALESKVRIDKRRKREKQLAEMPHPQVAPIEASDWRTWLDYELNRMPERYRAVLVACDLQGRSRHETARLLGLAEGTVSSRLARGRRLLAKRLSRYGLSLAGGTLAAVLAQEASAAVPASLLSAIVSAASGQADVAASIHLLLNGGLKAMFLTKVKWTVGAVMVVAALGATGLAYRASGQSAAAPAEKAVAGKAPSELDILRREVELLKLKLEVVQEKQRTQEAELHALRQRAEQTKQVRVEDLGFPIWRRNVGEKVTIWSDALRRDDDDLQWPKALQSKDFKDSRERINMLRKQGLLQKGNTLSNATLAYYRTDLRKMHEMLDAKADRLTPEEYIESMRYLRRIDDILTGGRMSGTESKPSAQQAPKTEREADLKKKVEMLESDLRMWKERAAWSERMSRPGRQIVTREQAEADQAQLRSKRLALQDIETQLRLQEVETTLKALRKAQHPDAKRRAADEMESAIKKLREQMDKTMRQLADPAK